MNREECSFVPFWK